MAASYNPRGLHAQVVTIRKGHFPPKGTIRKSTDERPRLSHFLRFDQGSLCCWRGRMSMCWRRPICEAGLGLGSSNLPTPSCGLQGNLQNHLQTQSWEPHAHVLLCGAQFGRFYPASGWAWIASRLWRSQGKRRAFRMQPGHFLLNPQLTTCVEGHAVQLGCIGVLFGCFGRKLDGFGLITWWFNHLPGKPIYLP